MDMAGTRVNRGFRITSWPVFGGFKLLFHLVLWTMKYIHILYRFFKGIEKMRIVRIFIILFTEHRFFNAEKIGIFSLKMQSPFP